MSEAQKPHISVMVIDDSKSVRRSFESQLEASGIELRTAEDGYEALVKLNEYEPDIIFTDIMMPRLDGYQTCSIIKKNPKLKEVPVVMLSSRDGMFDMAKGRHAGADRYLTKPFKKKDLFDTMRVLLGERFTLQA